MTQDMFLNIFTHSKSMILKAEACTFRAYGKKKELQCSLNFLSSVPASASEFLFVNMKVLLKFLSQIAAPQIGAFNSPRIGPRSVATVTVTTAEASGEIGFDSIEPMVVEEPASTPSAVRLKLTREGTSGQAVISWRMMGTGTVTSGDTGPTQGTVTMQPGKYVGKQDTIWVNIVDRDHTAPAQGLHCLLTILSASFGLEVLVQWNR